jgi:methylmalonyl-CoA mutase
MPLDNFESIFQQFTATTSEEWKAKIIKDLKDEAFDNLIWHTSEGIEVLPFYTHETTQKYQLQIPSKQITSWHITERIVVDSIEIANMEALHALENGATALLFDQQLKPFTELELRTLLKDILLDIAPVYFENFNASNKVMLEGIAKYSCASIILIPKQETIINELVFGLLQSQQNNTNRFHFYVGQNYFFEIAKLRAFRWLWKQICNLNNREYNIFIQCETNPLPADIYDENTNILRNTTAAMSAILGGCDGLIVNSHDAKNINFGKRIARNINHILQHESSFNEINDAAKGSYYIEYLTYQLCKKSWDRLSDSGFFG